MYFNLASCPLGWSELIAAQGRYLVGLNSGGTLAGTTGTALTDGEDRAVGQHNHGASSGSAGSHSHNLASLNKNGGSNQCSPYIQESSISEDGERYNCPFFGGSGLMNSAGSHSHSITVNNAGSVTGTNAPYIQLLVCQKD